MLALFALTIHIALPAFALLPSSAVSPPKVEPVIDKEYFCEPQVLKYNAPPSPSETFFVKTQFSIKRSDVLALTAAPSPLVILPFVSIRFLRVRPTPSEIPIILFAPLPEKVAFAFSSAFPSSSYPPSIVKSAAVSPSFSPNLQLTLTSYVPSATLIVYPSSLNAAASFA